MSEKVAVVTGANKGIGFEIARQLAKKGVHVIVGSRNEENGKKAADLMNGPQLVRFDASDLMPEAMNSAFFKGILDYVNNPSSLDSVLANLDKVQADAYKS